MLTAKDFLRGSRPKAPAPTGCPLDGGGEGQLAGGLTQRAADGEDEASHITNHKSQITIIENEFSTGRKERERKIILYILYII